MVKEADLIAFGAIWMIIAMALSHILTIYKISFIHESGLFITLGLLGGSLWLITGPKKSTNFGFPGSVFFDVLLPPVIFSAAYTLKRKQFINNFNSIMLLAIPGSIFNFLLMSIVGIIINHNGLITDQNGNNFHLEDSEIMLFAAIMSSTDGVAVVSLIDSEAFPHIFGTLIGEGCVNDAVSIILYSSVDSLSGNGKDFGFTFMNLLKLFGKVLEVAIESILIGLFCGLLCSYYLKNVYKKPPPKMELSFLFFFGYLSYSLCEFLELSAIIAVFFCGVIMSHYAYYNISEESQHASIEAFESICYVLETFIYLSLGFYIYQYTNSGNWSLNFLTIMLSVLIVGRIIIVGVCIFIINLTKKHKYNKVSFKDQLVFWWGGIVRGSICFALSLKKKTTHSNVIITTTFIIVIITTFTIGSLTQLFLECIGMKETSKKTKKKEDNSKEIEANRDGTFGNIHTTDSGVDMMSTLTDYHHNPRKSTATTKRRFGRIRYYIYRFDEEIMKKYFGGKKRDMSNIEREPSSDYSEDDDVLDDTDDDMGLHDIDCEPNSQTGTLESPKHEITHDNRIQDDTTVISLSESRNQNINGIRQRNETIN